MRRPNLIAAGLMGAVAVLNLVLVLTDGVDDLTGVVHALVALTAGLAAVLYLRQARRSAPHERQP